jgi:peptidyl-prolyl cis-trans isomerase B (cyclophilin B)
MPLASAVAAAFSILMPAKLWFTPQQPVTLTATSDQPLSLVAIGFDGKPLDASGSTDFSGAPIDVAKTFPATDSPGTYVLLAVPKGGKPASFVGTPIVEEVLASKEQGAPAGVMVVHLEPLQYVTMKTNEGGITAAFYYDVAPNAVDSFLRLASTGYYDGLTFHRIVPDFVIQGGDPRGDGTGGPGYTENAEFNDHPHLPGVLSMARTSDPNSAGSQFFVCLNYAQTKQLDGQYTAFGIVTSGMDAVTKIAATPIADQSSGKPATPQVIEEMTVQSVTPGHDPYAAMFHLDGAK